MRCRRPASVVAAAAATALVVVACRSERGPYYPPRIAAVVAKDIFDGDPPVATDLSARCQSTGPKGRVDTYRCRARYRGDRFVMDVDWDREQHVWPWRIVRGPRRVPGHGVDRPGPFEPDPDAVLIASICTGHPIAVVAESRDLRVVRLTKPAGPYAPVGAYYTCHTGNRRPRMLAAPGEIMGPVVVRGSHLAYLTRHELVATVDLDGSGFGVLDCAPVTEKGATLTLDERGIPGWRLGTRHGRCRS